VDRSLRRVAGRRASDLTGRTRRRDCTAGATVSGRRGRHRRLTRRCERLGQRWSSCRSWSKAVPELAWQRARGAVGRRDARFRVGHPARPTRRPGAWTGRGRTLLRRLRASSIPLGKVRQGCLRVRPLAFPPSNRSRAGFFAVELRPRDRRVKKLGESTGDPKHPPIPGQAPARSCGAGFRGYPRVVALIEDMKETMYRRTWRGLAAPQIGVALRLFIVDTAGRRRTKRISGVFINPELVAGEGKTCGRRAASRFQGARGRLNAPQISHSERAISTENPSSSSAPKVLTQRRRRSTRTITSDGCS